MFLPTLDAATPPGGPPAPAPGPAAPLPLFSREGFVDPSQEPEHEPGDGPNPLIPLGVAAGAVAVLHGLILLLGVASLPAPAVDQALLTVQWLAGALLVIPVGLCVHRLSGRIGPAVFAAAVMGLHPGVLHASLTPGGAFWAFAAVACALFLLWIPTPGVRSGRRPVAGLAPSAAAGLILGAGGVIAPSVAVLAVPLALWRLVAGFGCSGPGRGPQDLAAALVIVAGAAIPVAGFGIADGRALVLERMQSPHGEVVPRLIESQWAELLARFDLRPGLDVAAEVRAAFAAPALGDELIPAAPARMPATAAEAPAYSSLDVAVSTAWKILNAMLLAAAGLAAVLAAVRRRLALGLFFFSAVPLAILAGGPAGDAVRMSLLPVQLLLLGAFWLPRRRFAAPSAAFQKAVPDAGFTIKQNTPRVI
ncbi:hypothetical protein [Phycisphaera mikurensis]|uniref:Uncharacterized protein n=1 Tax=Phycisphaera mikurensis (strain NBRC 102666 / KCTC 22515 / FYK2301M01) TaxID=1142394 RepID=I0IBI1_PHYMF|nr:hypothetical protein [Phycisphaera mikurensis]MBB6442850.1 hypothetical protein [Phycisphaera mikurensis]BAM02619.1 hypothetical protein PSMK_04600 [Phycisphaera mikurensis NBRC 102666]